MWIGTPLPSKSSKLRNKYPENIPDAGSQRPSRNTTYLRQTEHTRSLECRNPSNPTISRDKPAPGWEVL